MKIPFGQGAFFLSATVFFSVIIHQTHSWRHERRPKVYGNRMPKSMLLTTSKKVQEKIVAAHNLFRANVRPKASNMLEMGERAGREFCNFLNVTLTAGNNYMKRNYARFVYLDVLPSIIRSFIVNAHRCGGKMLEAHTRSIQVRKWTKWARHLNKRQAWHGGAAKTAQKWAEKCELLTHDNATDRWTEFYGPCGQNIFVSTHKVPWFFAIKTWYLEHRNFTYGSENNELSVVGHFTQMVWATTHKVGCGYAQCKTAKGKPFFNYICNYCPIGNYMELLGRPYKRGRTCGDCPDSCSAETNLCTNSCPFADLWVNCEELNEGWHDWLCRDKSTEGLRRRKHCRATCHCKNKIMLKFS